MNITYLIGNGFDVGLNLKTRYKDFLPYYLENAREESQLRKEISKDRENEFKNWSDLEKSLGLYTNKVEASDEKIKSFIQDKLELDECLKRYLVKEQEKFEIKNEIVKESMISGFKHFKRGNNEREKSLIGSVLKKYISSDYSYQCIAYNYTSCVDRIWELLKEEEISRHRYGTTICKESLGEILHIHGTVGNNEMILGVNDESQIANKELLQNIYIKWALIKPYLNEGIGQFKIEKAKKICDRSQIICIYGMSIGETDNIWWEHIGNWLRQVNDRILIVYNYEPDYSLSHPVERLMHEEEIKKNFLNKTGLTDTDQDKVIHRIIVYDNENVFELKNKNNN